MKPALEVVAPRSDESPSCARLLKVLADETRLAVVEQLLAGPKHVGEINAALGVEQSLLSHHLKVLRDAGLVTARRDGKRVLYSVAKTVQGSLQAGRAGRRGRAINLGCCLISFD